MTRSNLERPNIQGRNIDIYAVIYNTKQSKSSKYCDRDTMVQVNKKNFEHLLGAGYRTRCHGYRTVCALEELMLSRNDNK